MAATFSTDSGEDSDVTVDVKIEETWEIGCESLIPAKSKARYEKTYSIFKKWLNEKKAVINERTLLAYFLERSNTLKSPGSFWAEYSMLKTTINLNNGINISQFNKLLTFLKEKNVGHHPKKSKVFTREEMNTFLIEAPDEVYLMMKVAMIMGIAGACRREELTNMTIDDIEDKGSVVIVSLPNTRANVRRTFTIIDKSDDEVHFLEIFRKYMQLRPENTQSRRLFYAIRQGKCINQVVGRNTMGRVPLKIAEYLHLEDPSAYTGHAFRRTSKSLSLADTGVNIMGLNRHSGWNSSVVTEGYMEDPLQNEMEFTEKNLHNNSSTNNILRTLSVTAIPEMSEDMNNSNILFSSKNKMEFADKVLDNNSSTNSFLPASSLTAVPETSQNSSNFNIVFSSKNKMEFPDKVLHNDVNNTNNILPTSVPGTSEDMSNSNILFSSNNIQISTSLFNNTANPTILENEDKTVSITFNNCTNCTFNLNVNK